MNKLLYRSFNKSAECKTAKVAFMKKKKLIFLLVFVLVFTGGLFAQASPDDPDNENENSTPLKESFLKPTFSLGIISSEGFSYLGMAVDADFILSTGLTFGVKGGVFTYDGGHWFLAAFGAGYMYHVDTWTIGGKGMVYSVDGFVGVGLDVIGTYWFRPNIGITGTGSVMSINSFTFFKLLAGVSMKF